MMRTVLCIAHFAFLAATVFAQSEGAPAADTPAAAADPTFMIADVCNSPHQIPAGPSGLVSIHGDRYILRHTTMRDLIAISYGVEAGFVRGGPIWLENDRFDIVAKLPPGATPDAEKLMLRSLLVDRFKLALHNGTVQVPGLTLMLGKDKVKMKPSDGSGDPECKFQPPPNQASGPPLYALSCHNVSMDEFLKTLHIWTRDYSVGPIFNSTGLKGTWDFEFKWSPLQLLANAGADSISLYDAADQQLGLKMGLQPTSIPVMLVDNVNHTPTPNAPDLDKIMPPLPPPEFEVATIKPYKPDESRMPPPPPTEWRMQGAPLKILIDIAWNLNPNDDEALINRPKWLDSDRYDIDAKLAAEADGKPPMLDIDDRRRLLRELLTERFQMKTHMEDRPIDAYTMIAVNPKLTKADPTSHTRCGQAPGLDGKDPRIANPAIDRRISCQNVNMAQTAEMFQAYIAPDYIYNPIQDATGITGSWDFTLSFSSANLTMGSGMGVPPPPDGAPASSEPNGAVSFFDAVEKQLGLKLVKQKRPLPVLVIDHIEEKPTEN
jgi:uncharacterized protein (TIGR03435 family)